MPRIQSAKKRVEVGERNRLRNNAYKSAIRTAIRKVLEAAKTKAENTETLLREAVSLIDKAVLKGVLKKNTAARWKSRIDKAVDKSAA